MLRRLRWGESWELGEPPGALPGGCGSVTPPSRLLQSPGPGPSGLWALSVKLHLDALGERRLVWESCVYWGTRPGRQWPPGDMETRSGFSTSRRPSLSLAPRSRGHQCPQELRLDSELGAPSVAAAGRVQSPGDQFPRLDAGRSSLPHWLGPCAPPSPRRVGPLPTRSGPVTREDPPSLLRGSWLTHHDRWENKAKL